MATSTKLVIVESPAKAHTISKFLGRGYKVEASQGHVRDLPKSQIGVDIEHNFEPKYITIRGRGEILSRIRKEAKAASRVYLATDPDREGEAISWHLAHLLNINPSDACRIEFNEITAKAVKAAVKAPRAIDQDLVNAQQARRVLDRLVGYKLSPLLWQKVQKGLSAGRVQSVATYMICEREAEINEFAPKEYWIIMADFQVGQAHFSAKYVGLNGEKRDISTREEADRQLASLEGASFVASDVKHGEKKKSPAAPFTTSNLQQEASRKLGFTTSKTMQVAQQLYEGVDLAGEGTQGLVTYIRTDSTRISDDALSTVREVILARYGADYLPETPNIYKSRKTAQDAHEAIRPTDVRRRPENCKASLSRDQYRLYKLIYDRFIASQMTPAVYDTMSAEIRSEAADFHFGGQHLRFPGFTAVYVEGLDDQKEEVDTAFPQLADGMAVTLIASNAEQKFTQAPPRYTEASLVRALEEKGIGRPSTYAPTISTIISRGYIARENKRLYPTELGTIVNNLMERSFPDIVNIQFTADMEDKLDEVESGKAEWHDVVSDFYEPFERSLAVAEQTIERVKVEEKISDVPCEKCGRLMVYKKGRFGEFLACPGFPDCRHTLPLLKTIEAPCPQCGSRLIERMSRKGRKFYGCERYPECQFVSWDRPITDACPACGGPMVMRRGRKGDVFHICVDPQCGNRITLSPTEDDDE